MKERPASVTVIAWFLIATAGISMITSTFAININNPVIRELMKQSPIPVSIQYAMMYAGLLISIVSGIAMLKGQNWARLLYVTWSIIGFMTGMATSPAKIAMIPGFVIFAVIAFLLFRPNANKYFTGADVQNVAESN